MTDKESENRPSAPAGEDRAGAWRIWPYALAFALMCFIYAGCKLAGLEWAANRPWGEVIFFLCVATAVIALFFCRKKLRVLIAKIREKHNH